MFYPLGKKLRKTLVGWGGVASTPFPPLPPTLYVWGLIELCSETFIKQNWIRGSPSIKRPHPKSWKTDLY